MKSKHKALRLSMCAVLLVAVSIFGTLAYLTDRDTVTNTFTVGRVGLSLQETGMADPDNDGVFGKSYHLLPGQSYEKDPTVTVDEGSEESYIRMMVTVTFENALTDATLATELDSIFTGYEETKWLRESKVVSADSKVITYEYRYHRTVEGYDDSGQPLDQKLEPLFTGFTVPGKYTNEQIAVLDGMTIDVQAHAIQAAGFDDADAAWTAFAQQHKFLHSMNKYPAQNLEERRNTR